MGRRGAPRGDLTESLGDLGSNAGPQPGLAGARALLLSQFKIVHSLTMCYSSLIIAVHGPVMRQQQDAASHSSVHLHRL